MTAATKEAKRPPTADPARPQVAPKAGASRSKKEREREAARERAKRAREKKKATQDPEQFAREQAAAAEAAAKEATAAADKVAEEAAKRERLEGQFLETVAGITESVAEAAQLLLLDESGPHLGNARARKIAEGWAPILAEKFKEATAADLALVFAAGTTSAALFAWAGEYGEYRRERDGKAPREKAKPAMQVVASEP